LDTKREQVVLELGNAVYEAITQNCWDNPKSLSISSLNQSIALLRVEIYLIRMGKSVGNIAANWSQLQPALLTYLKEQNIVLNQEMSQRLSKVIAHFGDKTSDQITK
jgi:hypothetical protein